MKQITFDIEAISPLAIGRQKPGGSISEAEDYIPGIVIRGAIAAQLLQHTENPFDDFSSSNSDFQALFLGDTPAIFQNAYPATLLIKGKLVQQNQVGDIETLPATALSSKTKPQ